MTKLNNLTSNLLNKESTAREIPSSIVFQNPNPRTLNHNCIKVFS